MKYESAKMTVCEPVKYIDPGFEGSIYHGELSPDRILPLVEPGMVSRMLKHEIMQIKDQRISYQDAHGVILRVPTVEAVPVRHEKWLDVENDICEIKLSGDLWKHRICTGCGSKTMAPSGDRVYYKYCPWCGARMG